MDFISPLHFDTIPGEYFVGFLLWYRLILPACRNTRNRLNKKTIDGSSIRTHNVVLGKRCVFKVQENESAETENDNPAKIIKIITTGIIIIPQICKLSFFMLSPKIAKNYIFSKCYKYKSLRNC